MTRKYYLNAFNIPKIETGDVVFDAKQNKIAEVRCFKEGHLLEKYSPKFKTKF